MAANAKMLALNPDIATLWNHRREALEAAFAAGTLDDTTTPFVLKSELDLTIAALKKNPKSYCAWHQRQWAVVFFKCSLADELALCQKFLDLDERNCTWCTV
jgi:geranylgeranyl transferase type-2 subunit alpha